MKATFTQQLRCMALGGLLILQPAMYRSVAGMQQKDAGALEREAAGDSVDKPGPIASDLSPALQSKAIRAAMRKVADWQLSYSEHKFNQQWTYAPLYDGLIVASQTTGDSKYRDAVLHAAERFDWELVTDRFPHADDEALGLAYLSLYRQKHDPKRMAATRAVMDRLVALPDDPNKLLWWWCDALFMAPPVLANISQVTGNPKYLVFMDHEWRRTTDKLYDPEQKLYSRDAGYLDRKEKNGEKLFWSRGNGWVLASLAQVLKVMPKDDPRRAFYEKQFKDMSQRIADLQGKDGLWRSGLLDEDAYTQPEVSGSAFFTYAMTWGINEGLLGGAKYRPVVERAWKGMLQHVYANGRLGSIQPIGAAPDMFTPGSSYVYGVGAFLLAGSELDRMVRKHRE